jgi:hypothetical protein
MGFPGAQSSGEGILLDALPSSPALLSSRVVKRTLILVASALVTLAGGAAACGETSGSGGSAATSGSGAGGSGGSACPMGLPNLTLTVRADEGPVPPDTRIRVRWSAADEPEFALDAPGTWKTLDDGVNVVCAVDRTAPPPTDLPALVCELWTNGATHVEVLAKGYVTRDETFTPDTSEDCSGPVPTDVAVELKRDADAGPD